LRFLSCSLSSIMMQFCYSAFLCSALLSSSICICNLSIVFSSSSFCFIILSSLTIASFCCLRLFNSLVELFENSLSSSTSIPSNIYTSFHLFFVSVYILSILSLSSWFSLCSIRIALSLLLFYDKLEEFCILLLIFGFYAIGSILGASFEHLSMNCKEDTHSS